MGVWVSAPTDTFALDAAEQLIEIQALHQQAAVEAMHAPERGAAHLKRTPKRKPTPEDEERAAQVVRTLRQVLEKYRDYRVAVNQGFEPFLPNLPQPYYHFTRKLDRFKPALVFDPAKPNALLYRKTDGGFELIGALYVAPKDASERELHRRVPLSVAQWHAHVNVCLPPKGVNDWTRFGLRGSIADEAERRRAGGRFVPQLFGWMVAVFPFNETPEAIWEHPPLH